MEQQELTEMMAMTQETERKMIELSALNYLFSTHVLRQAQQIETLYMRVLLFSIVCAFLSIN